MSGDRTPARSRRALMLRMGASVFCLGSLIGCLATVIGYEVGGMPGIVVPVGVLVASLCGLLTFPPGIEP